MPATIFPEADQAPALALKPSVQKRAWFVMGPRELERAKWLAFALMVIDHAPKALRLDAPYGEVLGRGAMPLFCLALGGGLAMGKAHGIERRLLLAAVLSQPIYVLTFGLRAAQLNVLFTLLAGVTIVRLCEARGASVRAWAWCLGTCPLLLLSDYGIPGAMLVPLCYLLGKDERRPPVVALTVVALLLLSPGTASFVGLAALPLWIGMIMFVPVRIPRVRGLFYYAYPAHLFLLVGARLALGH